MAYNRAALAGVAIIGAQFSINVGSALGKTLFPVVGPEGTAALRTGIAALILLVIGRPWRINIAPRQWAVLVAYGVMLGGMNLLIYWAFERIPIGIAVAIEITGPLAVVLLTSRSARDLLWLAVAVLSLLLLIPWPGSETDLDLLGIAYALGAAACWALYIIFGKRASEVDTAAAISVGMSVACLATLPFGIAAGGQELLRADVLAFGVCVAILSSALPYSLEMKALGRLTRRGFGIITSASPAIAAVVGFFLLGEDLSGLQWIAIAMMIIASAGCSSTARPASPAEEMRR